MPLLLALLTLPGCRSPEDVGFEAGAKYIAIFVAIGADTMTMPCPERLAMAHEFADQGKANRIDLASDVGDAREEEGFDAGLKRIAGDTRTNVFGTFAKACPTEAPEIVELMTGVETELGITGKLPPLELPK
ncbi:MAG: hypothetical protein AB1Z98_16790 [Nannocystaceae bacterium]